MDPNRAAIIVTGSSGMIGSPLCTMLGATYNVVGFDRAGLPYPPIEVECVSVDLTAEDRVRRALERVRYAYGQRLASVIHLAAYYDFSGEPSPLYGIRHSRGHRSDVDRRISNSSPKAGGAVRGRGGGRLVSAPRWHMMPASAPRSFP